MRTYPYKLKLITLCFLLLTAMLTILFSQSISAQGNAKNALKITAPRNVYAHIFKDFPQIKEGAEEIVLEALLYSTEDVGESSWLTSLALFWSDVPERHAKLGYFGNSGSQVNNGFRGTSPGVMAPLYGKYEGNVGMPHGMWVGGRITVTPDRLMFEAKGEEDWFLLKEAGLNTSNAAPLRETRPSQIILGKGYRPSGSSARHFDASAPAASMGPIESTYIAELTLRVDGEEVFRENFENLDGWDIHIDPDFADFITIEVVENFDPGFGNDDEVDGNDPESPPHSIWAPQFQTKFELPGRDRIPLVVDWDDNEVSKAPVTFGVPFPKGLIDSPEQLRLVADGCQCGVIPAQIDVTATWDGPDGSVRWALINTTLEKGRDYYLEYGSSVKAPALKDGIKLSETKDAFVITTGPLRAEVSKRRPTILDSAALDLDGDGVFSQDEMIVTPRRARANLPVVVDSRGNEYVASSEDLKVEIARSGPMEVVVRREGWYVGADGTRFSQFVTYTYFYHGQSGLRHDHTLVVAFDSTQHQIRDIRLSVPLQVNDDAEAVFARDGSADGRMWSLGSEAFPARLIQTSHNRWMLTSGAQTVVDGERAGGWFGLGDERWGALAGWRDFWQQYPAELEVEDGVLHLHLWPSQGVEPLDFTPSVVMGDDYPGDRIFHADFYRGGLDSWTQAYGVGKTHNLWIGFYAGDERDEAARLIRSFTNKPVLALTSPEWNAATEVMGRIHAQDREQFPEVEAILDAIIHRKLWLQEHLGNYGWIDFGDVNYTLRYSLDKHRITFSPWRRWASMFYGWPNVAPLLYLRSGQREAWDLHRTNTRHITDIDIAHLDSPQFNKTKGGRYGGNGGIVHYAANMYAIGPDSHLRFMLYDYYINGNLRTREVADYYLENYSQNLPKVYQHRGTGGALRLFSEAYEATWDPKYLENMRHFARLLLDGLKIEEQYNGIGSTRHDDVYMNEGKVKYYQLTGEEWMRDLFLNDMRTLVENRNYHVHEDIRHTTMWGLAHAYWMTGDEEFLDFLFWQLEIALGPAPSGGRRFIPTTGDPSLIGATGQSLEHAYHATLGNQLPSVIQLLADLDLPISYLVSEPRTIRRSADKPEDGPQPLVIYAPDGFRPPALQEPVRVYFRVPEHSLNPGIHFSVSVRLYNPDGEVVNNGIVPAGWFDLPTDQPGLWSFEPLVTSARYQVTTRGIPPFFALEQPERYFEPDIPWIYLESPLPGMAVRGELPIEFKVYGTDKIDKVRVIFEDEVLYEGSEPPQHLSINTYDLEDRVYRLHVEAISPNHTGRMEMHVRVHNWWQFRDELRAPIGGGQSAFGSFFGSETVDLSLTSSQSPGWTHATEARADFFGDDTRMVRKSDTTEYLIWDLPHSGLNTYEVTVYVQEEALSALENVVQLSVRTESADEWSTLPYRIKHEGTSNAKWHKVHLTGHIDPLWEDGQFRLVIENGQIPANELQLGRVDLAGYRGD